MKKIFLIVALGALVAPLSYASSAMCLVSPFKIKTVLGEPVQHGVGDTEYSIIDTTLETCISGARQMIIDQKVDGVKVKFDASADFDEEQTSSPDKATLTLYKR